MKRAKQRCNKAYRPKHIHIPMMPELQRAFLFDGHGALASMRLAPNPEAFVQLAGIFNVISIALQDAGRQSAILDSGIRTMQGVADRANRGGKLYVGRYEILPIENAMIECEDLIKGLDVVSLNHARIKVIALQRLATAAGIQPDLVKALAA